MYKHKYFDLRLHDNEELNPLIKANITERVTLHEWPHSCVQQLTLDNGRKLIYKSQKGTIESKFYACAKSDLLPQAQTIYSKDGYDCILIEFIDTPLLEDLKLPEEEVVRIGGEVLSRIAAIKGNLPYIHDIHGHTRWERFIRALLEHLGIQIKNGTFKRTNKQLLQNLEHWAFSKSVLKVIQSKSGYVHHDLTGDNLFILPDGYRVIDWQRGMIGPTDLDMVTLLGSLGFDPLHHVDKGTLRVNLLLQISWFRNDEKWIHKNAFGLEKPRFVVFTGE